MRTIRYHNVAILGFGREGKSVLQFLKNSPEYRNAAIEILDQKHDKRYLKNLERFDIVFRSPGIPYELPELRKARAHGVKFSSATAIFFERCPAQVVGVTGTKGKGTTATLIHKILKASGRRTYLAGNVGLSPLAILPKLAAHDIVVLELSSFQLQDLKKSPHVAVILDLFPDHQDAHRSLREYYSAKANIVRHQRPTDKIFFFKNSRRSAAIARASRAKKYPVDENALRLFTANDLKIRGNHNFKNAVMAANVCRSLGVPNTVIAKTAKAYKGMKHRLESVRCIGTAVFYNDSASTNPHTAAAAIRAFPNRPVVLIAGGQDKNLNYRPLGQALKNSNVKLVVLFGENKKKIANAIRHSGVPMKFTKTLKEAVRAAYRTASTLYPLPSTLYPIVLFSPAAASFDMFENYADRGEQFKTIVKTLKPR